MAVASPQQYREMLDAAHADGFAYPAINVTSSQTLNAAISGLARARSDGIVQITTGGARYFAGPADDMALGALGFAALAHVLAARAPVLVALHTDHCTPENVDRFIHPLLAESRRRRACGEPPLFNSHMFDGSELPLADNMEISARLLREADELDVVLEVEIGAVGGQEDGIDNQGIDQSRLYSTPEDARAVARAIGLGEQGRYLLAATFGNVHGHYAPGHVRLRPELLADLQHAIGDRRGRFEFVFHGGSGSSASEIRAAIANGVVKFNLDTDLQYAFTHAIEAHFGEERLDRTQGVDKRVYDPRAWGGKAERAMAARVVEACGVLGSRGRTLARVLA